MSRLHFGRLSATVSGSRWLIDPFHDETNGPSKRNGTKSNFVPLQFSGMSNPTAYFRIVPARSGTAVRTGFWPAPLKLGPTAGLPEFG